MNRIYKEIECGCIVSCDGGGGLAVCCDCGDCKFDEWRKKHPYCNECGGCIACGSCTCPERFGI